MAVACFAPAKRNPPSVRGQVPKAVDWVNVNAGELASIDIDPIDSFWDLSADGRRIAFGRCEAGDSHIRILNLADNEESQVKVPGWACLTSIGWSPDGKSFFATTWASKGGSLLHVSLRGETKLLHRALGMSLERPVSSP